MIYRLLGAVSVFVGAVFGLIALAVLVPFLNTFSGSLLILVAVFSIVAWVFLAIGWQLLRPPKRPRAEVEAESGAQHTGGALSVTDGVPGSPTPNGGSSAVPGATGAEEGHTDEEIDVVFGSGFAAFDVIAPGAAEEAQPEAEGPVYPDIAGLSIDERLSAAPVSFRKPYQVPAEQGDAEQGDAEA